MSSKRLLQAALLSSAAFLIAAPAFATPFTVNAGQIDTAIKSVSGNDTGTIQATGTLQTTSSTGSITWSDGAAGNKTVISNSGTVKSTGGRALESAKVTAGSLEIDNHTGASMVSTVKDALQLQSKKNTTLNGSVVINNDGLIAAQGTGDFNGQAIDLNDLIVASGKIDVENTVNGQITAADSDAIRASNNALINNYGLIQSSFAVEPGTTNGNDSGNDGIDFNDKSFTGTVNNYQTGSIIGARHGITAGQAITVTNDGIITGNDGSGINLDTAGNTTAHITNNLHGVITGNLVSSDGDGVDVDGQVAIENYGQIKSLGSGGANLSEGLAIGGGTVNNYASGLIEGADRAITVDDSNLGDEFGGTTIVNEGTIKGDTGDAIKITSCTVAATCFSNTLTNRGTIIGNVALGNGDDTLNLGHGSSIAGTVDGQGGNDAVHLADAGTVSNLVNFETLSADSGTSTLTGTQTYSGGASVQNGATLGLDGATLNANVGVASGGTLSVGGAGGTVNGDVTNNGNVQVNHASATFNGHFTNNGTFSSDPATMTFNTFENDATGVVHAAPGDVYKITADFLNHSTQNTAWDTSGATLEFTGGGAHTLLANGTDFGPLPAGYVNNFVWGELLLDGGNALTLDGVNTDSVFYTHAILGLDIVGNTITNITGGFDIYYDAADAANAYLGGLTYDLEGGGKLIAAYAPEPATLFLAAPALIFLRRKRVKVSAS